jgi:hypothetical protein
MVFAEKKLTGTYYLDHHSASQCPTKPPMTAKASPYTSLLATVVGQ